jgi:hypothetical protein
MNDYILLFLTGGAFTALIKYISSNMYFIVHEDKIPNYLYEYLKQTILIAAITVVYLLFLHHNMLSHTSIYLGIISLWILLIIIQYYFSI